MTNKTHAHHNKALALSSVSKSFDGRPALLDASFEVEWGEIHALLGENGAGKSTLMNVACGLYAPDSGNMAVSGELVKISSPADAIKHSIGMVHQHYKLVDRFTIAENVFLSCGKALGVSSPKEAAIAIQKKSRELNLEVNPNLIVGDVSIAEQQRVEILKMLLVGARVLILDEPTAVLTDSESEAVLALLRDMANDGCAVVLITHKLREVIGFSDRVTVMRAGGVVMSNENTSNLTLEDLANAMVGKSAEKVARENIEVGKNRYVIENMEVSNLSGGVGVDGISFKIRAGEIYGIAGVGGNGQPQLASALMGLAHIDAGKVKIDGRDITRSNVLELRRLGLRFIPSDRFRSGLIPDFQAYENYGITEILNSKYGSWVFVNRRKMKSNTAQAIKDRQILGCSPNTRSSLLSGGNAQKLLLSRELDSGLGAIIAHSPTRGLDIQACNTVHKLLLDAASNGAACLLISEDLEEVLSISSTIAVMSRGKIVGEFSAAEVSREKIGELMLGHA